MSKILLFLTMMLSCSLFGATNFMSYLKDDIFFFTPFDVLKAYEGKWKGNEELSLKGRLLGNISIENTNKFISDGILSSVGTARMADEIMDTNANILVFDNKLYLKSKGENGEDLIYEGHIKNNSVEWFRTQKIFPYDYTRDLFSVDGYITTINTYSVKPHKSKSSFIYLEHKGSVFKDTTPREKLKINARNLDISKLRI